MYKVLKDKGHNMTVSLENTDMKATVRVGMLDMEILRILEVGEDISFGTEDTDVKLNDAWVIPVRDDTAKELQKYSMRMKKPERDQSRKSEQVEETKPKRKQPVDVFNLIFGIDE